MKVRPEKQPDDTGPRADITPLMSACRSGDLQAAQSLIDAGADVNARNRNGTTPLMYAKTAAAGSGDLRVLELLVAHGAQVDATDNHGLTALDYARKNFSRVIEFLQQHSPGD